MQPLQICIGPTIRIGPVSWFLPYAGFLLYYNYKVFCEVILSGLINLQYVHFLLSDQFMLIVIWLVKSQLVDIVI